MRALVVTNMHPTEQDPARGSFVRDQVAALKRLGDVEVELFSFRSRGAVAYTRAAAQLRSRYAGRDFDVVHAHFGLTIWPSLALPRPAHAVTLHGTDLIHPLSRAITSAGLPFMDLVAPVSEELAQLLPRRLIRGKVATLPVGVDLERFHPVDRFEAREALGLERGGPYLLFAADPARPEKRYDRALELAEGLPLLSLGRVSPVEVPLWVNAANAVLVTSEREGFGLAVLEALACDVPVLSTPVGIAPDALTGIDSCHCGPFDAHRWRQALAPLLADEDPRVAGRAVAASYSTDAMAAQVLAAWQTL